jgi:anti-sigma B factor antagonist
MSDFVSGSPGARISVEGELTIYSAREYKQTLLMALRDTDALEVDLSGITEIDSSGVQLLALLRQAASKSACKLCFTTPSPAVREVSELLDIAAWFNACSPIVSGQA